ncbi:MAG: DUF4340 domain-containing protein [Deltaproteobacteria bacterium]|nr:DUF4340 domain-containing protein [Deltaproteobacteria bacterium]
MSSEVRRVLVLGVLACVLGGYAYVTTPEKKTVATESAKKTERAALDFTPEHVTQIDLLFDGQHLVCQRTPEGWKQSPGGTPVRPDAIEDFLTSLKKLVNLGEVEGDATQLSEYGLKPPVSRLTLQVEGEGPRTLALGKHNPVQTSLYAQINESPQVVLVGAVVLWDMRKLMTVAGGAG